MGVAVSDTLAIHTMQCSSWIQLHAGLAPPDP